eukprot:3203643-Pyramimonas_sp.AAC.1
MEDEVDGWQDVEKNPSGAAGSSGGGKKPKPSARPKPKSTPAASRFQSDRIHVSGDDVRSLVDRYRARLDEFVVDFANRARDHRAGYVTDCELEVFRILTAKQLQDVLLMLEQPCSGTKRERIDRLIAFIADEVGNSCEHKNAGSGEALDN